MIATSYIYTFCTWHFTQRDVRYELFLNIDIAAKHFWQPSVALFWHCSCTFRSRLLRRSWAIWLYHLHLPTVHEKTAVKTLWQSGKWAGALVASRRPLRNRNGSAPLQNKTTTAKFSDYWDTMQFSCFKCYIFFRMFMHWLFSFVNNIQEQLSYGFWFSISCFVRLIFLFFFTISKPKTTDALLTQNSCMVLVYYIDLISFILLYFYRDITTYHSILLFVTPFFWLLY